MPAPLSPIHWAAGFRNCFFDAFCKELEHSPDSEELGPTAETPVVPPAPAPETPLGQSSARPCSHIRTGAQRWLLLLMCPQFLNSRPAMQAPCWGFRFRRVQLIFSIP